MTFPLANLIHKRHHISRSRIVPCVSIAAVALAAALLLLASTGMTRAEAPGTSAAPQPATCDGLTSLTLVASPAGSTSGSSAAPDANCNFEVTLGALPTQPPSDALADLQPCVVTSTPFPTNHGVRIEVRPHGSCDELRYGVRINFSPVSQPTPLADAPASATSSISFTTARAMVEGNDLVGLDLFRNVAQASWDYTASSIVQYYFQPWLWTTSLTNWTVQSAYHQHWSLNSTTHRGVQFAHFHIHIPIIVDSEAYTRARLDAKAGGAFTCEFPGNYYVNPHLGLYSIYYCERF